jgi:Fe-Mn family superoxide dismutase
VLPLCVSAGGGAFNHALYFKHLTPAGSTAADPKQSISPALAAAIDSSFGSLQKMQEEVTAAATKVFGSGWAWVCYTGAHAQFLRMCMCMCMCMH